ncbi:MAG: PBP1A family penicillin-binding protein [Spirochaetia bacterium]|nr:PBP1A family penicillin-binding protein [Spirochaetia bacterium]
MKKSSERFNKWLKRFLFICIIFSGISTLTFVKAYLNWNSQKEEIIGKLFTYKKQLDQLRSNLPVEELGSEVNIGTVAIPSRVYDKNDKLIGEFFTERRTLINLDKLPLYIERSLIASEDRKFYEHHGIRYSSILRAILKNIITFQYSQGGSTLTQQLAKVLFTNQEKTIDRKIFEFFCTKTIEERFTKKQILEMYLNLIYMGHGNFGVESASQYYFNKSSENLSLAEASILIGLLPSPEKYSPINDLEKSLMRQRTVLNALIETKVITKQTANISLTAFYAQYQVQKINDHYLSTVGQFPDRAYRINMAPYFLEEIRKVLLQTYTANELMKGGLRIYTTLDYDRQHNAEVALKKAIAAQKDSFDKEKIKAQNKHDIKNAEFFKEAREKTNGAFITIEPKTGYVLTMIGGSEFSASNQFNRSTSAYRQVGSLLKPFIYYLAIAEKKITPATIVKDEPLKVGKYDFHNYDGGYLNDITVYEALKKSRNTIAVKILQMVGVKPFKRLLEKILDEDLSQRVPNEAGVALGTPSFTPIEVATLYSVLINNGRSVNPVTMLRVEDSQGHILWTNEETPKEKQILKSDSAYIIVQMLTSVFEKEGTSGWVADYKKKNPDTLNFEIAGKTGTTSDHKDAWFAGLTSDEVSIVWIGSDMNAPLGNDKSGGSICSPVWIEYIQNTKKDLPPEPFKVNYTLENITHENFCLQSGGVPHDKESCPNTVKNQSFLTGTEPDFFCPIHK